MRLSQSLVLSATGCSSLNDVRNINLWAKSLSDISIVRQMPNVEVLSLSVNEITSLIDFGDCNSLKELYLRNNKISDVREIQHLRKLGNLRTLWLCSNPCITVQDYRLYVLHYLPQLTNLDNSDVSPSERQMASEFKVPSSLQLPSIHPPSIEPVAVEIEKDDKLVERKGKPLRDMEGSTQNLVRAACYILRELDADALRVVRAELERQMDLKR
ncbi:hypothetical protein P9112_002202 [Eukaryota sp. TZLM1-RC]